MATVILKDGRPVNIPSHVPISSIYLDIYGFLVGFQHPYNAFDKIKYYSTNDFATRIRAKHKDGYYSLNQFNNANKPTSIVQSIVPFDFSNLLAKPGNEVVIKTMVFESPYTVYHQQKRWKFVVERLTNGNINNYLAKATNTIALPPNAQLLDTINGANSPQKKFYDRNFGTVVTTWPNDIERGKFAKVVTTIAMRQRAIVSEIFPKITNQTLIDQAGNDNTTYATLNSLQKLLFNIKKNWAYYYQNGSSSSHATSLQRILPDDPNYGAFIQYLRGLNAFYRDASRLPLAWSAQTDTQKYEYLLKNFSSEALTVLSYIDRVQLITKYALKRELTSDQEDLLVKIIESIEVTYADNFLDFLNTNSAKVPCFFKTIYDKISDDRLARYIPFTTAKTNRMYFVKKVLQLWKQSKYNIFYANGMSSNDVNTNAHFNYNNLHQGIIEFKVGSDKDISYGAVFKNGFVQITRDETSVISYGHATENYIVEPTLAINKVNIGKFHLFQPLFVIGFKPDLEVAFLNEPVQPAFLFFYCQDFEKIKEFDAAMGLVINIGVDLGFTFLTGGAGGVKYLSYLKHFTEMGRAIDGVKSATTAFKIWTNVANATEYVALTAGTISALSVYVSQVTNDPDLNELANLVATLSAFGALSTLPMALYANAKVISSARKIAVELANLSAQNISLFKSGMSASVKNAINEVVTVIGQLLAKDAATITAMANKLNGLGADANTVKNLFENSFTNAEKVYFYISFSTLSDKAKWRLLNANSAMAVQRWRTLLQHKIPDFNRLEVLISANRYDGLINLYVTNNFETKLDALTSSTRLAFIDKFYNITGANLTKLLANDELITYFARFYNDLGTRAAFYKLSSTKMLEFLEDYGNASMSVFSKFRRNPSLFKIWEKVIDNPLNSTVNSVFIKRIDYLELVDSLHKTSTIKNGKVITLEHHIAGEMNTLMHNGIEHITGYSGFHFDFKITEATHITPTTTNIGGNLYMTGPIPTSGSLNPAAIKAGSYSVVNGIEKAEVLLWGYASRRNLTPPPPFELVLDTLGNPIRAWVPKRNNGGSTTLFSGWNKEKTFNEIAYARLNLTELNWVSPNSATSFSNEWRHFSSEGTYISMYIGSKVNTTPLNAPNLLERIHSAFPKQ